MSTPKFDPTKTFFTSDPHFGHANLLIKKMTKRHEIYGEDINFMNEDLIRRWNEKVPVDADVFVLGDMGFLQRTRLAQIVSRLNGRIHYVIGNHDENWDFPNYVSAKDYEEINVGGQYICLSHYPFYTWNGCHRGSWMLCGHEHGNTNRDPHMMQWKIMDVGIDCHPDYVPFSFDEIKKIMDSRGIRGHH